MARRALASATRLTLVLALGLASAGLSPAVAPALASTGQVSILEDDGHLMSDPAGTLQQLRALGVGVARVDLRWQTVAPHPYSYTHPSGFDPTNPGSYSAKTWAPYDEIVRLASRDGIQVDFDLDGGAPLWATGPGAPTNKPHPNWEPSGRQFGQFVQAVGTRYSGSYTPRGASSPLPRVDFWSVWNEPNLGFQLAPQGVPGNLNVEYSPNMYRHLLDGAWHALQVTGHGSDTILIAETGERGTHQWGEFAEMHPLIFLRALYCVNSRYQELRGNDAQIRGCPTTAAGSRRFVAANPALFSATGYAQHMWKRWFPPNARADANANDALLGETGGLKDALDRLQRVYGQANRFPIYDTEFGYITSPPRLQPFPSPTTAAYYLNWGEYISWRDRRMASFDQYLLRDGTPPSISNGGWASGLVTYSGRQKATFDAFRLPLYLPNPIESAGRSVEVWGCVRPAPYAQADTGQPQTVDIQFQSGSRGRFKTMQSVKVTDPHGYFDVPVKFPRTGIVRLAYTYPTGDSLLPSGHTVHSRSAPVTVK